MKKFGNKKYFLGFTIIEIIVTLGFIATATIVSFVVYQNVAVSAKSSQGKQGLASLSLNIKKSAAVAKDFSQFSTANIITDKLYPQELLPDPTGTFLSGPWGPVVVNAFSNSGVGTAKNEVFVVFTGLDSKACVDMLTSSQASYPSVVWVASCSASSLAAGYCDPTGAVFLKNATTNFDTVQASTLCGSQASNIVSFRIVK